MSHYDVIEGPEHVPIKAWTRGAPIEDAALKQLKNVASPRPIVAATYKIFTTTLP